MKITIWHDNGAGSEFTSDDYAYIEVNEKTVWNKAALKTVEGQKPAPNQLKEAIVLLNRWMDNPEQNLLLSDTDRFVRNSTASI